MPAHTTEYDLGRFTTPASGVALLAPQVLGRVAGEVPPGPEEVGGDPTANRSSLASGQRRSGPHEKQITGAAIRDPEWQTTVAGIEVRDDKGSVHYRESFPYEISGSRFSEPLSAAAGLLQGRERSGLLVTYGRSPSTPLGGQSWQVFGLFGDRLVPFCRPISVEGDLIQKCDGNVVRTAFEPGLQRDVLHFRVWTGNFFVVYPVRVDDARWPLPLSTGRALPNLHHVPGR